MRTAVRKACLLASLVGVCGAAAADGPTVAWRRVVAPRPLTAGVLFGGCSDLARAGDAPSGTLALWTITDRGPNGTATTRGDVTRRTLLAPDFTPSIAKITVAGDGLQELASVDLVMPLTGASGRPLNGRLNGVAADEPMLEADGASPLAPSPDGVDTEGLVPYADGFWACEEYRPSLVRIAADGRVLERHVPQGTQLVGADTVVIDDLPAAYAARRDNRGFEALALSHDGTRLFALLQSPLEHPRPGAASETGNVRFLVLDAATGRPVAEHLYRLGDPADGDYLRRGCPPDDGKLCAMAVSPAGAVLALEQAEGLARVYRIDLSAATDTLGRGGEPIESIRDLPAAAIEPIRKHLVADLGLLLGGMRRDVFGDDSGGKLKLEGMVALDDRRLVLVNDNDFGVHQKPDEPPARTCLWCVVLPAAEQPHTALTNPR